MQQPVIYAIKQVQIGAEDNGSAGCLRTENPASYWAPGVSQATLHISFEETNISEIHLGIVSDLTFLVKASLEPDFSDSLVIAEKCEKAAGKPPRLCRCVNSDVPCI